MKLLLSFVVILSFTAKANVCAPDAKKFCQGVEPGKGQWAKCLDDHQGQLSPACAKELKEFNEKTAKKNPCFQDLAEYCVDIPVDPQRLAYCLLKHEAKLSATCSADFKKKKGNFIVKDVCAQDIANTCYASVSEAEGSITRCLIKNKPKLSTFCQKSIDKRVADMKKKNPCFDDTEKNCPTQVKFMDIQECLEKKLTTLAPSCQKVVKDEINKGEANPCYRDLRRHCKPGIDSEEQHRCLEVNTKDISNACRDFRNKEADKVKKMVTLCEADRLKLCPKAPFQKGMILKCLRENKAKVSQACKELL
jgi:hypothetical protein